MPDFFLDPPCPRIDCHCRITVRNQHNQPVTCKETTDAAKFGLYDDDSALPAYILHFHEPDWAAKVHNPKKYTVTFRAIDQCADMTGQRCEGMLLYEGTLAFVELKYKGDGWLSKAMEQIRNTLVELLKNHPPDEIPKNIEAYACNGLRPNGAAGASNEIEEFKKETAKILDNTGINITPGFDIFL